MRHRASRSPFNLLRRLPRAVARPLGALAALSPVRALLALAVALGFGTGTFVAVASVGSGAFTKSDDMVTVAGREAMTTSRDGGRAGLPASESAPAVESDPADAPSADRPSSDLPFPEAPSQHEKSKDEKAGPTKGPSVSATTGTGTPVPSASPSSPDEGSTPDSSSPDTSLSEQSSDGGESVFSMSASEDASFACSLDGAEFEPCDSPASYSDLDPGWHTLAVRATDSAGNVDPTPAEIRWHVSAAPSRR